MLGEGACWPRTRLLEAEPMQHSAQGIREAGELFDVDVFARDDLGLKAFDLDCKGRRLPDKDLAGLAQPVLPAEVISERDGYVTIAARDHAAAVDATKKQRIVCRGASNRKRTQGDRRAIPPVQPMNWRRSNDVHSANVSRI
jgi:hypothetical protein